MICEVEPLDSDGALVKVCAPRAAKHSSLNKIHQDFFRLIVKNELDRKLLNSA